VTTVTRKGLISQIDNLLSINAKIQIERAFSFRFTNLAAADNREIPIRK
jgi:hypothetical protein